MLMTTLIQPISYVVYYGLQTSGFNYEQIEEIKQDGKFDDTNTTD